MYIRYCLIALVLGLGTGATAGPFSISPDKEMQIGREAQRAVAANPGLSHSTMDIQRVQRVGKRLVDAMTVKQYPFEVTVLNSQEVNAFCLPGGFIDVYEGLLQRLPGDDALAFVVAHEMAHASLGHWRKQSQMSSIINTIGGVLDKTGLISGLVSTLITASYSRDDEREADGTAVRYVFESGMDPKGGLQTMDVLSALDSSNPSFKMLRTHPPSAERRVLIDSYIQKLPSRETKQIVLPPELAKLPPGIAPEANPYLPFATGGTWAYTRTDDQGNSVGFQIVVKRRVPVGADGYYRLERQASGRIIAYELLATKSQLWRRGKPDDANSQWCLDVSLKDCSKDGVRFINKGYENVKLGCGDFPKALRIRKEAADADEACDIWIAEGVGIIRRQYDSGLNETLKEYTKGQGD